VCKAGPSLAVTAAMSEALNSVAMEGDKRQLSEREVVPHQQDWGRDRRIDRAEFARAAKAGIYALQIDERFGGR
jgi:alkylation response protein AidB-like acyl-CoA dehydrogenase